MDEFSGAELGDRRLTQRLCRLAEDLAGQPEVSIPKAAGDWGQTCAAYRFLDNDAVQPADILAGHKVRTLERAAGEPWMLAVNDTTSLNYSQRKGTSGLGPIRTRCDKTLGLWLHSLVAFTPQGVSFGVVDAQSWARNPAAFGSRHQRKSKRIEQKESYKWLQSFQVLQDAAVQTPQTRWVMIADREADLYELFELAQQQPNGPALLVRANHDRNVLGEQHSLFAHLACAGGGRSAGASATPSRASGAYGDADGTIWRGVPAGSLRQRAELGVERMGGGSARVASAEGQAADPLEAADDPGCEHAGAGDGENAVVLRALEH